MDDLQRASKKRKRNGERARVTRACDRCKKKIKCDGLQPCEFCCRAEASCTFETAYTRGKAPRIMAANGIVETCSLSADPLDDNSVARDRSQEAEFAHDDAYQHYHNSDYPLPFAPPSVSTSTPNSLKQAQTGLHGQYIGPASGVSFLQRVQKRLGQAESFSQPDSIFTFGDAPLASVDADLSLCMTIPRELAQQLLDRYFDFAMPTYRFLHRPTTQAWFAEFYDTFGIMRDPQRAAAKIALVLMVLAHGRVYMPEGNNLGPPDLSHRLYSLAEQQLAKESGPIRLTSVQARLTQCYYLLTQSRINHCWRTFGTVSQLALAIGLNRSTSAALSNIETEGRRRTFWCAYTLDVHLSVVLGRPQLFHDDDIDTELPADIEDDSLVESQSAALASAAGFSTMLAPLAHINLARIVKRIIRQLYPLRPIAPTRRNALTSEISKELVDWRSDLTSFLDTENFNALLFLPIVQRQRNVLNLTYWHAVILTHRPSLLSSFKADRQTGALTEEPLPREDGQAEQSINRCLESAMNTVRVIDQMTQSRQMYRAFWIAAYFAFTASIVLYLYAIQKRADPPEVYSQYLSAAVKCQSQIADIAEEGSLLDRYRHLLEELRLEATRQTDRTRFPAVDSAVIITDSALQSTSATTNDVLGRVEPHPASDTMLPSIAGSDLAIPDLMSDFADWDQFASMVSSGLGNLDAFLGEYPFGQMDEFASAQY